MLSASLRTAIKSFEMLSSIGSDKMDSDAYESDDMRILAIRIPDRVQSFDLWERRPGGNNQTLASQNFQDFVKHGNEFSA